MKLRAIQKTLAALKYCWLLSLISFCMPRARAFPITARSYTLRSAKKVLDMFAVWTTRYSVKNIKAKSGTITISCFIKRRLSVLLMRELAPSSWTRCWGLPWSSKSSWWDATGSPMKSFVNDIFFSILTWEFVEWQDLLSLEYVVRFRSRRSRSG